MAEKVEDEKEKELLEFLPLLELLRGVAGPSDRDEDDKVLSFSTPWFSTSIPFEVKFANLLANPLAWWHGLESIL